MLEHRLLDRLVERRRLRWPLLVVLGSLLQPMLLLMQTKLVVLGRLLLVLLMRMLLPGWVMLKLMLFGSARYGKQHRCNGGGSGGSPSTPSLRRQGRRRRQVMCSAVWGERLQHPPLPPLSE